jgi:quercetin dioxygenase-like cupin family protein
MTRIVYSLLVATLPFGSVLADAPKEKNAKVTLVYQHELPNVPGKSIKGVLVEYGPGGYSPGHTHPKSAFIYATVLEGAIRSQVNDGPVTTYKAGQSFSELPGDRHGVSTNAIRGHERDGPDDPVRELRFDAFRPEILPREIMRDADACVRVLVKPGCRCGRPPRGDLDRRHDRRLLSLRHELPGLNRHPHHQRGQGRQPRGL